MTRTSRRTLLRGGLGLGLGALCLPSLLPRGARAEAEMPLRRLLIVLHEHGTVYDRWRMRPGGLPDDADWEVPLVGLAEGEFSEILRPLYAHRDRLRILDGIGNPGPLLTATNEHQEAHATVLTGTAAVQVDGGLARAEGPSIDQLVATAIAEPGQIASLALSQESWPYCFDAAGYSLPYIVEPLELYKKLFPDGPGDVPLPTDAAAIRARQRQVVELAGEQYTALAPKLGALDRMRVEQHRDLLAALAVQLDELAKKTCDIPAAPEAGPPYEDPAWYDFRTAMYTTLTALALSCDLTRVAVIALSELRNSHVGAPPGAIHNDFAHAVASDPVAAQVMADYHRYHTGEIVKILDALAAIPSAGGTLLDDTLVVWGSELGTGDHHMHQVPFVVAGGASHLGGSGRYVRWRQNNLIAASLGDELIGPPHNRLLVSIARAMGLDVDAVGLQGVKLKDGTMLDCTGPLDRLG